MDNLSAEQRRLTMAAVKSCDTTPELVVRKLLHGAGVRFRLHRKDLPGKPDIVIPKHHTVILVHGCFWHQHPGCKHADRPASHLDYWQRKLDRNVKRDEKTQRELEAAGWKVIVIWECETRNPGALHDKIFYALGTPRIEIQAKRAKDEAENDKTC